MVKRIASGWKWGGAVVGLALMACSSDPGVPDAGVDPFDRRPMLASMAEHVILPTYRTFAAEAAALKAALDAYVASLGTGDEAARRQDAQAAWRRAMAAWQQAELMQLGPAGPAAPSAFAVVGGEYLRDEIYSWPTVSTCRVDQEVVAAEYGDPGFFDSRAVNAYGLDALEYLLFNDSAQNTCAANAAINTSGAWAALSATERTARRAAYAQAVAGHLKTTADLLVQRWDPSGDDFARQLGTAGEAGSAYESARMAADELFGAIFYLDLRVKDAKLAVPAGISTQCGADVCPEALESQWARVSKENLIENLRGFRRVFLGNAEDEQTRLGFDDWLEQQGVGALADQIVADTDAAIALIENINGTLQQSLLRNPRELRDVHAAVKKVTDELKTQFPAVLGLRVPGEGASDND